VTPQPGQNRDRFDLDSVKGCRSAHYFLGCGADVLHERWREQELEPR